jgi:hypothetical protein
MKLRTKATTLETPTTHLHAVENADEPKTPKPKGGARPGAGRPPFRPGKRKERPAYIGLTSAEYEVFERRAEKRGLTLSFYLREKLGLPIA